MLLFLVLGVGISILISITDGSPTRNENDWSVYDNDAATGVIAGLVCLGLLLVVAIERFKSSLLSDGNKRILKVVAVLLVAAGASTYFYTARAVAQIRYPKTWDSYHYFLGAKYFRELGYNNLYACHVLADSQQRRPKYAPNDRIRDLENYRTIRVRQALQGAEEVCSNAFSDERWEEFKRDTRLFDRYNIKRVINDHGYNGTPLHAVIAGGLAQIPEVTWENLVRVSFIDIIGLSIMFAVVVWAFGWKVAFLFALFFFTNFADRFGYIGASYFRYQWMVTLGIGLALLKKEKYAASAVFITLSAMLNVFPLLFFSGIGAKIAHKFYKERRFDPNHKTFLIWAIGATLVFGGISLMQERNIHNYSQFLSNMSRHSALLTKSRIGFQYNFHFRGEIREDNPNTSFERKAEDLKKIRIP
jgi:hypothetical protein